MAITSLGSFVGANSTDTNKRIPAALSALNKALAGDTSQLVYMRQQSLGSATAVGKEAFKRALAIYDAQKPSGTTPTPQPPVAIKPPAIVIPQPVLHPPPTVNVPVAPTPTVTKDGPAGMPVGFDPSAPIPIDYSPVIPGVRLTGIKPGVVKPVTIGSDGGVIAGPPAPEYSGPASAPLADASFGYVAPAQPPAATTPATTTATAPTATKPADNKVVLLLAVAVLLYAWIEGRRK